jgi:hypothetical protein
MNINAAALSKINWTQAVGFAAMAGAVFGFDITPERQVEVVLAIGAIQSFLTIIWRTWFTAKAN